MSHRFNEYRLPLESSLETCCSYLESLVDRPVDKVQPHKRYVRLSGEIYHYQQTHHK